MRRVWESAKNNPGKMTIVGFLLAVITFLGADTVTGLINQFFPTRDEHNKLEMRVNSLEECRDDFKHYREKEEVREAHMSDEFGEILSRMGTIEGKTDTLIEIMRERNAKKK